MAYTGAIFTTKYHTKQLNPWPNSSANCVVNYTQLSACQGDMQPFEGNPSTCGCVTSLRKIPQQKQPRQLSSIITCLNCYSMCTAILWWWEVCLAVVCMEAGFLKPGHNFGLQHVTVMWSWCTVYLLLHNYIQYMTLFYIYCFINSNWIATTSYKSVICTVIIQPQQTMYYFSIPYLSTKWPCAVMSHIHGSCNLCKPNTYT